LSFITLEFFPFPFLFSILILAVLLFRQYRQKHRATYLVCYTLLSLYLLAVAYILFFPIRFAADWTANISFQQILWSLSHINLIPFNFGELFSSNPTTIFEQLAGNILLTLPFGFLLPFLVPISRKRKLWIILVGALAIEIAQLAFQLLGIVAGYGHSVDINDAMLNAVGVLVGYGTFLALSWIVRNFSIRIPDRQSTNTRNE
jgi:glycopeptide antibiotics resistance protein